MSKDHTDAQEPNRRRQFLTAVTSAVGVAGAGAMVAPFVASMTPSARAQAAGAPVEVDIGELREGHMMVVEWRGKPVWILHRSAEMLGDLREIRDELSDPDSLIEQQPAYATNDHRSIRPEILVVLGVCTHLGCAPTKKFEKGTASGVSADWRGGFFCPCHGSRFDLAGRVFKNVPAPTNLEVPPHSFVTDSRVLIGVDNEETA
jgi:ubiquinol-cytochrome c reductase iron-sulfur subunit